MKDDEKKAIRNLALPFVVGFAVLYIVFKLAPEK
jgi:hypothetical protein